MERLQKVIAQAGVSSRRQSEHLISSGKVKVNGKLVTTLGLKVDPGKDDIEVNGARICLEKKRTFLFYKPMFVISSMFDPQGRKVVPDFFQEISERVFPVGRLDFDTEGLLIVTNDGKLANHLTHPRYEIEKVYVATVIGNPTFQELQMLRKGVVLEDGPTVPADVQLIETMGGKCKIELIMHEGRNRQVRRMFQAIGYPVQHLIRKRIGFLDLKGLKKGEFRELNSTELEKLQRQIM